MTETKYIPFSELKVGMEIRSYKKGCTESFCRQEVESIKKSSVALSWEKLWKMLLIICFQLN